MRRLGAVQQKIPCVFLTEVKEEQSRKRECQVGVAADTLLLLLAWSSNQGGLYIHSVLAEEAARPSHANKHGANVMMLLLLARAALR